MKRLIAILTSVALWAATLPVVGCTVTAQQIQEEGATVGNMLISMANVVQDPASAAKLQKIGQGLIAATANFQLGSPTAIINDSINAAEVVLASIPKTQAIALLLPIAEAAIDILIANLNKTTGKMGPVTLAQSTVTMASVHHRLFRSPAGDMKAAYNDTVTKNKIAVPLI